MIITPLQLNKVQNSKLNKKQSFQDGLLTESRSNYGNIIAYNKPKIHSIYENYDTAQKVFRKNLNKGLGIFGEEANVGALMQNDVIRRNVVVFFAQYSKEQIEEIDKNNVLPMDEVRYRAELVEVNNFFSEYKMLWPESELPVSKHYSQKKLAFTGTISDKDERDCKNIVHAFSAACGLVSGAMGEGAAVGADTPILRIAQATMFSIMATKLKVSPIPSMEYYLKEMCQGANLGVGGAKLLTSWLGIAGHTVANVTGVSTVTGGGTNVAITGGVRAVNGTLSTLITEKMGRGYIRRVKENQMTLASQSIELGSYFVARGVLTHQNPLKDLDNIDFKDSSSPELIKNALMNMPKGYQETASGLLGILAKDTVNVGKLFLGNFALTFLAIRETDPKKLKKQASQIFRNCLIQSVSYELANVFAQGCVAKDATETIKNMQENLEKYPEVYRIIINKEHEFFEQINLDSLKSEAFAKQFTNRNFVLNLSRFLRETVREVEYAWINKDSSKNSKAMAEAMKKAQEAEKRNEKIKKSVNTKEQEEYERMLEEMEKIFLGQFDYLKKYDNFGYGRIGGYEDLKDTFTQIFIKPLSLKNTSIAGNVPSSILLYGPTSVGKTQMVMAACEQGKCKLITIDDFDSAQDLQNKLDKIFKEANSSQRHYVIKIDEFDEFAYDENTMEVFRKYVKRASSNNVTFMLTTNNPLDIDKDIIRQSINIPVKPASKNDFVGVLKHYIKDLSEEDYEEIAQNIVNNSNNGAYSNVQIEHMCYLAMTKDIDNIKQKMIQLIKDKKPEISQKDIDNFYLEIEAVEDINNENNTLQ